MRQLFKKLFKKAPLIVPRKCPFCGGVPRVIKCGDQKEFWVVQCSCCYETPVLSHEASVSPSYAIRIWNERADFAEYIVNIYNRVKRYNDLKQGKNNYDEFKAMSLEELAEWLDENGMFDGAPWSDWFTKCYCDNCESIKINYRDAEKKLGINVCSYDLTCECAYCELEDKCRFFPEFEDVPDNKEIIKLWLQEEAK